MLGYFPFAASLEKENAAEGNLWEVSTGYFILGVEKRDGGRDGGRRPDLGLNILNYTLSFKRRAEERKEEVAVLWSVGKKPVTQGPKIVK